MGCIMAQEPADITQTKQLGIFPQKSKHKLTETTNTTKHTKESKQKIINQIENISGLRDQISGQNLILVHKAISKHFLFYGLDPTQKYGIIRLMTRHTFQKNQYIFRRGDSATTFYIILNGLVQVQTGLQEHKFLHNGETFGDLALIYETSRSFSVIARENSVLWGIESIIFKMYMNQLKQKNMKVMKRFIERVSFFCYLSEKEKENIIANSLRFKYKAGSRIFSRQDPANCIFIIIQGRVQMLDIPDRCKIFFEEGDMFGEGCLMGHQFRLGTAECIEDTQCFSISKNLLLKQLQAPSSNILFYCICKWALKRSSIFNLLKKTTIDKIIYSGQMKFVMDGAIIESQGHPNYCLYICLEGRINNSQVGAIFNQRLQQSGSKELRKQQSGFIFSIKLQVLTKIINRPLKRQMQTKQKKVKFAVGHVENIEDIKIFQKIKSTQESQFLLGIILQKQKSKCMVHCIKRSIIAAQKNQLKIQNYISTLKKVSHHSLIPKIYELFNKDPDYIFIVKQYVGNYTLAQQLQSTICTQYSIKFYLCCIIEIVKHLHSQNVVHGAISDQAFMIGQNGYVYSDELSEMIDLSMQSTPSLHRRTKSLFQTPHYMAPEVINGEVPTKNSDIWSIGILIHRMVFGRLPFGSESHSPYQIYEQILLYRFKPQNLMFSGLFQSQMGQAQLKLLANILTTILVVQKNDRFVDLSDILEIIGINTTELRKQKLKVPNFSKARLQNCELDQENQYRSKLVSLADYFAEGKISNY